MKTIIPVIFAVILFPSCTSGPGGVNDAGLAPCPERPNCVSSQAAADDGVHRIEPFDYSGHTMEKARLAVLEVLEAQDLTEILVREEHYIHALFRTPAMRFKDDVEFYFPADEPVIHIRSASRLGYSDGGTNRRRVEHLRAEWRKLMEI